VCHPKYSSVGMFLFCQYMIWNFTCFWYLCWSLVSKNLVPLPGIFTVFLLKLPYIRNS